MLFPKALGCSTKFEGVVDPKVDPIGPIEVGVPDRNLHEPVRVLMQN